MTVPVETREQALRRISTGLWIRIPSSGWAGGYTRTEHAVRRQGALTTRCCLRLKEMNGVRPADGTALPCELCLRSIKADEAMQIPISGTPGALATAMERGDEMRNAARALAGMLVDAKVHPMTVEAVLSTSVAPETVEEVMRPWRR